VNPQKASKQAEVLSAMQAVARERTVAPEVHPVAVAQSAEIWVAKAVVKLATSVALVQTALTAGAIVARKTARETKTFIVVTS